jgi:uncharacterized LabA/DUF88 family protein
LQLSSKDALTYVYKKTIYLINNLSESKQPKSDIINTINMYLQVYKNSTDNIILTRKDKSFISAEDIERLKTTIMEIKTDKKKSSEWVKYFKEMNIIDD